MIDFFRLFGPSFLATVVVASALAFLSVHVILRRVVFVGVALSQLSSLGIALAFFLEGVVGESALLGFTQAHWFHWVMGWLLELVGLAFLMRPERGHLSREARIGVTFAASGALAVLLVASSPHGMDELRSLMAPDPLFTSTDDLIVLFATMIPSVALVLLFFRRFLIVAFDREMAISLGVHAARWDVFFYLLLGVAIAMAIHLAGVLFAIGFLVLPGAAALCMAHRPWQIFGLASGVGFASSAVGTYFSHELDLPAGPSAVATVFAVFLAMRLWHRLRHRAGPRNGDAARAAAA